MPSSLTSSSHSEAMADALSQATGSLTLLGFRPLSSLTLASSIVGPHAYFLYPDEGRVSGSRMLAATLIERMHDKGVYGVT